MHGHQDSQRGTYATLAVLVVLVAAAVWWATRPPAANIDGAASTTEVTVDIVGKEPAVPGGRILAGAGQAVLASAAADTLDGLQQLAMIDGISLRDVNPDGALVTNSTSDITIDAVVSPAYPADGHIQFSTSAGDELCLTVGVDRLSSTTAPGRC